MVKFPFVRIAILLLCALHFPWYGAAAEKPFPKPSFFEVAYYYAARSFDRLCTQKWMPRHLQREPFVEIPLADVGITAANSTLVLGMQPTHYLAEKILDQARQRKQQIFTLSLLAPFEAKHTSTLMAEGSVEVISARDNIALSVQVIDAAVRKIEEEMAQGNRYIYVHCKSGVGRSATVVAAYLLKHGSMTHEVVLALLKQLRPHTEINRPGCFHYIALQAWKQWAQLGSAEKSASSELAAKAALIKIIDLLAEYHKPEVLKKPWAESLKVLIDDLWQQSNPGVDLPASPRDLRQALELN